MNTDSFKVKLNKLIQKSRKAIRIYSSASSSSFSPRGESKPFADLQLQEWRNANEELLSFLIKTTNSINLRKVFKELEIYRNQLLRQLKAKKAELEEGDRRLSVYLDSHDYVNINMLSKSLVVIKTFVAAKEAVIIELNHVLGIQQSSSLPLSCIYDQHKDEKSDTAMDGVKSISNPSKIIPFRKQKASL